MDAIQVNLIDMAQGAKANSDRLINESLKVLEDLLGNKGQQYVTKIEKTKYKKLKDVLFMKYTGIELENFIYGLHKMKQYEDSE